MNQDLKDNFWLDKMEKNKDELVSVKLKAGQLDRMELIKVHPRQPLYEVVDLLLDEYDRKKQL